MAITPPETIDGYRLKDCIFRVVHEDSAMFIAAYLYRHCYLPGPTRLEDLALMRSRLIHIVDARGISGLECFLLFWPGYADRGFDMHAIAYTTARRLCDRASQQAARHVAGR